MDVTTWDVNCEHDFTVGSCSAPNKGIMLQKRKVLSKSLAALLQNILPKYMLFNYNTSIHKVSLKKVKCFLISHFSSIKTHSQQKY